MVDKERSRQIRRRIRRILMAEWDPIGVSDTPEAADEYDSYIGGVYELLEGGASQASIYDYLHEIEADRMEMSVGQARRTAVASSLVELCRFFNGASSMIETISLATLKELFDCNYWARDRQLQTCASLTEEQFLRPLGNSFPSVRDTMTHLLAVEWLWLERWRGKSPKTLLGPEEFPTLAALSERWQTVEREMREYVAGLTEEELERPMTCVSTRGQAWTYELWRMVMHLLQHQTYHRGQVTALFRQLGIEPPKVDFLDGCDASFRC